jgi:serine O-acetyltransferase
LSGGRAVWERPARRCFEYGHHRVGGVCRALRDDLYRHLCKSPENVAAGDGFKQRLSGVLTPHFMALLVHRCSHFLHVNGWSRTAAVFAYGNMLLHRVNIPPESCIGSGCFLPHPAGVTFCGHAGRRLTLYSLAIACPDPGGLMGWPEIGDDVTVGAHAVVLGPVRIADRVFLCAAAVVQKDINRPGLIFNALLRPRVQSNFESETARKVREP